MKKTRFQKVICFVLSVTMLLSVFGITVFAASDEGDSLKRQPGSEEKNPYSASTLEQMQALVGTLSYAEYLSSYSEQRDLYRKNLAEGLPYLPIPIKDITEVGTDEDNALNEGKIAEKVSLNDACKESNPNIQDPESPVPDSWSAFGSENYDKTVYLPAEGYASWQVTLEKEQEGFYYIRIEYYSVETGESSISAIERKFKIDDKVPFNEVSTLKFDKNWVYKYGDNGQQFELDEKAAPGEPDSYDVKYELRDTDGEQGYYKIVTEVKNEWKTVKTYRISQDINGNSMAPEAISESSWNTYFVKDSSGYYDGAFEFYFQEGTRTITLEAEREPMIIKSIELIPVTEPVTVTETDGKISVVQNDLKSYEEVLKEYKDKGYTVAEGGSIIELQAEFPDLVSDSSVAATNDNTSAENSPISSNSQLYNVIGENSYSTVGQWAAYKFAVTKTGLYNLAMRFKQDALQGMYICRTIKIHGGQYGEADGTPEVPFAEAYQAEFNYDKEWQSIFVSKDDIDFLFYFEEGVEYTVYFECSLGTLKEYIQRVEVSLEKINNCYLKILQLTGTDPDEYRDYEYITRMPEVLVTLLTEAIELMDIKEELEKLCGTNGSHIATLETIANLLYTMGKENGMYIASNMSTLKSYLGTLGTWINSSKSSSMIVDSIWVIPAVKSDNGEIVANESALPKAKAGFFKSIWFEIKSFVSSFFVDYDQMGLTRIPDENTLNIDVWLATGRDQSQIWRTMIDANDGGGFTQNTGTAVSLKLVTGGTLLPSILSRKGPDVYLGLGASDVINYAIRDAVLGISGNTVSNKMSKEDNAIFTNTYYSYKEADGSITTTTQVRPGETPTFISRPFENAIEGDILNYYDENGNLLGTEDDNFSKAAMDTVTLLDVSYGIPQTMTFAMMFYRMDVLANLGLSVPESWDELLSILPVLQTNNMSIGVSYIDALDFMIYQKGGSMWKYTDESLYESKYAGARIDLDSEIARETFDFTCRLYSDYSFPVSYDASNRFRTGEMPIIIGGYSGIYNTLTVYATEIEGLWEFCSLPGSKYTTKVGDEEKEVFNYDSLAGISASVILYGCEGDELLASWQFLQWQTGEKAQANYGNRMVALIGPSAKYETANLKAINNLSWTASEKRAILNQMDHLSSIVNYPGSYIINRYTQFAFLEAVNESADPIDALTNYIDAINSEIARKREEFKNKGVDLWVPKDSEDNPPQIGSAE